MPLLPHLGLKQQSFLYIIISVLIITTLLRFLFAITTHKGSWNPRLLMSKVITAFTLTSELNLSSTWNFTHNWIYKSRDIKRLRDIATLQT